MIVIVGQVDVGIVVDVDWYGESDELFRNDLYDVKDPKQFLDDAG